MSDLNTNQVVTLLLSLARELQGLNADLDELERDAVTKAELLNAAHSKALLKADGPQYVRVAIADDECAELRLAAKLAEVEVRATKRKMDILRERIGVGRTVVASLRAELELERTTQ